MELPDSGIFLMRLVQNFKHLEIQIVADMHQNVITLFGRECSVQLKYGKIIEEGPITSASLDTVKAMERFSKTLVKELNYVGIGTVEFLYCESTGSFYFLEINARIQVFQMLL